MKPFVRKNAAIQERLIKGKRPTRVSSLSITIAEPGI
jgi:hypothetical protein